MKLKFIVFIDIFLIFFLLYTSILNANIIEYYYFHMYVHDVYGKTIFPQILHTRIFNHHVRILYIELRHLYEGKIYGSYSTDIK